MNLIAIPANDWRKVQREGERTRDAHLIRELSESDQVESLLIVNRPIGLAEMAYRKTWWKSQGTFIHSNGRGHLVQIGPKSFVLDLLDRSNLGPILNGKGHFFDSYGSFALKEAVDWNRIVLGMNDCACVSFNIYAAALFARMECEVKHFDAWDNFLRFPANDKILSRLKEAYTTYSRTATSWSTNSDENRTYYDVMLGVPDATVIRNGVRPDAFKELHSIPADLLDIPRPIVGMGLKVTHLLDVELLNQVMWANPRTSFVLVGQIIDRAVYNRIRKLSNFHYLGDKHYKDYPAYVTNFDACLIPYCLGEKQHGGDAIKFYEYLAANKPIVATPGNGVTDDYEGVWLRTSPSLFGEAVQAALENGPIVRKLPENINWSYKAQQLLDAITSGSRKEDVYVV